MKEKIDRLAKGLFSYELPAIEASEQAIEISVETGRSFSGSFTICNSANTDFKGIVYSSSSCLSFYEKTFSKAENNIEYVFDASYLDAGDVVRDRIVIVSECGEIDIPFCARVIVPSCESSMGSIRDAFLFTNLAKSSWDEATKIFMTDNYERVLRFYDKSQLPLFEHLKQGNTSSIALEEFLIASHKKHRIGYSVEKTDIEYDNVEASISDKLIITKDTWGYDEIKVSQLGDFLELKKNMIWTEEFEGNSYELPYTIKADCLHGGRNIGAIILQAPTERITITISVRKKASGVEKLSRRKNNRRILGELYDATIRYKLGDVNGSRFMSESAKLLKGLSKQEENNGLAELFKIYTLIQGGRDTMAKTLLNVVLEEDWWKNCGITVYGAVVFLQGLLSRDNSVTADYLSTIQGLLERDSSNALLFLFNLELDKRGRQNRQRRFDEMKHVYEAGSRSGLLYAEAYRMLLDEPQLLKELSDFTCAVLLFGIRRKHLVKSVAVQMAYLAGREKNPTPMLSRILRAAFEISKTDELLEALCQVLIRLDCTPPWTARFFRSAILEQLQIPELPEYLLRSAYGDLYNPLPGQVFMFYSLNHKAIPELREYLYANLICFGDRYANYYQEFGMDIRAFAQEQLELHRIDSMLAIIYEDVYADEELDSETASLLANVVYKHIIRTDCPGIKAVAVASPALTEETLVPVICGEALVDIFMEGSVIFLVHEDGSRFCDSSLYSSEKLVRGIDLNSFVLDGQIDDYRAVLHTYDCITSEGTGEESSELLAHIASMEGLTADYKLECDKKLIYHYYDSLEGEHLEEYLVAIDLRMLSRMERNKILEFMILRDLHHLALSHMEQLGHEDVDVKRLLRMCSVLLPVLPEENKTDRFCKLCYYVFKRGKYDASLLEYLVKNYNGGIEDMYELLQAAEGFDVDSVGLEERIVAQILFTENDMSFARQVFKRYYLHGPTHRLVRAFLSYYSYGYLRDERMIDTELMQIMKRELLHDENDICLLALLKGYSGQENLDDKEKKFIEYSIMKLEQKGEAMSFMKNFAGKVKLPASLYDKHFIEYITKPLSNVVMHSRLESEREDYREQKMKEIVPGVYVLEYVLFYGEGLQYYISEENENGCSITESRVIRLEPEYIGGEDTKYHMLNLIITAKEMNDNKTVLRMLETYLRNDYESMHLFRPL